MLRWFLDGNRMAQLAVDNGISKTTAYEYLHEGIDALAARTPGLHSALLAAKAAGHEHISVDGTLIRTDRVCEVGPTLKKDSTSGRRVDLWWSGKHHAHGGNIQVITVPDGWPIWTSEVRPGREHDVTALRTHPEMVPALTAWTTLAMLPVLGDLGYEGQAGLITVPMKKPIASNLTDDQRSANKTHNGRRAIGERGNSLLKSAFKALRRVTLCPWRIGAIVAAVLTLLHIEHNRMV